MNNTDGAVQAQFSLMRFLHFALPTVDRLLTKSHPATANLPKSCNNSGGLLLEKTIEILYLFFGCVEKCPRSCSRTGDVPVSDLHLWAGV